MERLRKLESEMNIQVYKATSFSKYSPVLKTSKLQDDRPKNESSERDIELSSMRLSH